MITKEEFNSLEVGDILLVYYDSELIKMGFMKKIGMWNDVFEGYNNLSNNSIYVLDTEINEILCKARELCKDCIVEMTCYKPKNTLKCYFNKIFEKEQ